MTYWLLNAAFVAVAAVVSAVLWRAVRRRPSAPDGRRAAAATGLAFAVLCGLTAVFDNVMIAAGLFGYSAEHTSGLRIGRAPLEDFAYVLGGAVLLPALWVWLQHGGQRADQGRADGDSGGQEE